jgi:hypothetical protein
MRYSAAPLSVTRKLAGVKPATVVCACAGSASALISANKITPFDMIASLF